MMCSRMNEATTLAYAFLSGIASAHLVKHSVAARIQILPFDGGEIGPTRSKTQV